MFEVIGFDRCHVFRDVTDVCLCVAVSRWKAEDLGLWSGSGSLCSAGLHHLHDLFSMVRIHLHPAATSSTIIHGSEGPSITVLFYLPMEFSQKIKNDTSKWL